MSVAASNRVLHATDVIHRVPSAAAVRADGEAVVLDELNDQVHLLNTTATVVWECLDGSDSLVDIAVDLAEAFQAPVEQVLADVVQIAQRFVDDGLAAVHGPGAPPSSADLTPAERTLLDGPQVLPEPPSP